MSSPPEWAVPLPSRRDTKLLARRLAPCLAGGDLVILVGALGAGKTFFVRAICRALGVPATVSVTSPTFTLVNEHPTEPRVVHADLYRLENTQSVWQLGLLPMRDDGALLFVEWGEDHLPALGGDGLIVRLALEPRRAILRSTGPRSDEALRHLQDASEARPSCTKSQNVPCK